MENLLKKSKRNRASCILNEKDLTFAYAGVLIFVIAILTLAHA